MPDTTPVTRTDSVLSGWTGAIMRLSVPVRLVLAGLLLVVVAALDFATGDEVSFSIFYLVPVAFAGAFVSRRAGIVTAFVSAAVWGYGDSVIGSGYSAEWIAFWNTAVRLGFFLLVNELVVRLGREHARVQELSRTDSLTGIANARVFDEQAARVVAESRRSGRPFTIAYLDLDRFKTVNDSFGHSEGDRLLRAVAAVITASLRTGDIAARLGGDEFGILLPETDAAQGRASLERIEAAIAAEVGSRWEVGATCGAVTFTEPPPTVDCAVRQADDLMYQGKAQGRGGIVWASWPESGVACD